jgi:hypothetical protein
VSFGQSSDQLTVGVHEAIQLVLLVSNLFLDSLHAVHRPVIPRDLRVERLVADLLKSLVNLVTKPVVAAEAEQLLVGVIGRGATIADGSGVNITLVHDSSFVHAPPRDGFTPMRTLTHLAGATPRPPVTGIQRGM